MSLEDRIADLTTKVETLTEVTQRLYELRATTVEEIKQAAAGAKAPAKGAKAAAAATEAAAAEPEKTAEKPAAAAASGDTNRLAEVQKVCAAYAGGTDDKEEREARKEKLTWLFGRVGATKLAEIPAGKEAAVIKAVNQLIADGDLIKKDEVAEGDDDLLAA